MLLISNKGNYALAHTKKLHLKNCKNGAGKFKLQKPKCNSQLKKNLLLEQFMKIKILETFLIIKLGFNVSLKTE